MKTKKTLLLKSGVNLTFITFFIICSITSFRAAATVYTVNSLTDAGTGATTSGDLRYCITQANLSAGPHTINFSVAGTINLTSTLPVFIRQISVMGNTAPGYATTAPVVELNGTNAGWAFLFNDAGGANSVVQGLVINRAQLTNIEVNGVNGITIQNCFIGTNLAGTASAGVNPNFGIQLVTSSNNFILNNVLSGHVTHGLLLNVNSLNNTIKGNKIGTNALGTAAIPNGYHGIEMNNTSTGNIIGGTLATDRNVISGNTHIGLSIIGGSANPQIINNYIGVNAAGTAAISNGEHGIFISASASAIITNNVVSGNSIFGILIMDCNTHTLKGNYVGVNAAGTTAIANINAGVSLVNSATAIIGGTTAGDGNVLSGNGDVGLRLESSISATVQGNFIGTNATGTGAIGNNSSGIYATTGCNNNRIGGNSAAARNIISCNKIQGIQYVNGCNDLIIEGNYIGTDATGAGAAATFGNGEVGIVINTNCLRPTIGGTTTAQRNIISGNGRLWPGATNGTGIQLIDGVTNAVITGNYIGLAADGTTAMGNKENGIVILGGCDNVIIGGNTAATRNLVSSNGYQGIVVNGSSAPDVIGNYIGTDATGTLARGNGQSGVILIFASDAEIGRASAGQGNLISNNGEEGVHIIGGTNALVYNNLIGVALNGTTAMGNKNGGVYIQGVGGGTNGSNNIVGGLAALQPNTIAYSTGTGSNADLGNGFGIGVAGSDQGLNNVFIGNKIFCNAGLGIDLNFSGLFGGAGNNGVGNGGKVAPSITAVTSTTTSGTGINGETIHVYSNVTCTTCQGETYLGSAVVSSGTWSITHVAVTNPAKNSATATNSTQGTSQFSCNTLLPVGLLSFNVKANGTFASLDWQTAWETNNEKFEVQKSLDGITFEKIGEVKGQGTVSGITNYSFEDDQVAFGNSYYRLKQVDMDGKYAYSEIRAVNFENLTISVFPNPASDKVTVRLVGFECSNSEIILMDAVGKEVTRSSTYSNDKILDEIVDLSGYTSGIYYIKIQCDRQLIIEKIIKK